MENLKRQLNEYVKPELDIISNLSNITAILNVHLDNINWVGFYLADKDNKQLKLGPFQGLAATPLISYENGVCGLCARSEETIIVDDVHCFEGHIACDFRSNSEIVVPIFKKTGEFYGLIDTDSPSKSRFTNKEKEILEYVSELITSLL